MKYFLVLMALSTAALASDVAEPESRYACYKDKIVIQIKVAEAGVYTVVIPATACGQPI